MEGAPDDIDYPKLYNSLKTVPGVKDVGDLHVWSVSQGKVAATAHLRIKECEDSDVKNHFQRVLKEATI